MSPLFAKAYDLLDPGAIIPLAAIVMGCLIPIVAVIAHSWKSARQAEIDAALKQDMLNRGMSAADIERVISAGDPELAKKS